MMVLIKIFLIHAIKWLKNIIMTYISSFMIIIILFYLIEIYHLSYFDVNDLII